MDKVDPRIRNEIFENRVKQFKLKSEKFQIKCFPTSIWENTLYKAWSNILRSIIPNIEKITELLGNYSIASQVDDIALFEKNTFLCISSFNNKNIKDNERYEKICGLMKKLKNTCRMVSKKYNNFLIKNIGNIIYFDDFGNSTYIMVVLSKKNVSLELLKINIEISKKLFNNILNK
jgi:Ras-related GTP-binding protein A/B